MQKLWLSDIMFYTIGGEDKCEMEKIHRNKNLIKCDYGCRHDY